MNKIPHTIIHINYLFVLIFLTAACSTKPSPQEKIPFTPDSFKNEVFVLGTMHLSAKKRYQHIFREYLRKKEIGFLWYVVPTQKMGEHLISLLPTADYGRQTLSFFWSHLENVLHSPKEVVLHGKEFSLPLKDFAKSKNDLGFPDFSKPHPFSTETTQTPAHSDAHPVSDPDDYDHL